MKKRPQPANNEPVTSPITNGVRAYLARIGSKGGREARATAHRYDAESGARAAQKRWRDARQARAADLARASVEQEVARHMRRNRGEQD